MTSSREVSSTDERSFDTVPTLHLETIIFGHRESQTTKDVHQTRFIIPSVEVLISYSDIIHMDIWSYFLVLVYHFI